MATPSTTHPDSGDDVYVVIEAGPEHRKGLTSGPEAPDDSYHSMEADQFSFASETVTCMLFVSCEKRTSRSIFFFFSLFQTSYVLTVHQSTVANSAFRYLRFVKKFWKTFRESDGSGLFSTLTIYLSTFNECRFARQRL